MPPITAVVLGAGGRGTVYGAYALKHPHDVEVVAIAEPQPDRLARFATQHDIPPSHQFASWEDVMRAGKIADVIAVDADPLQDIKTLQKVSFVMKAGTVYKHDIGK